MHFKSPRLFVMWDTEIRKRYRIPNEGSNRAHVAHHPASDKVSLRRNLSAQEAIRCSYIWADSDKGTSRRSCRAGSSRRKCSRPTRWIC